MSNLNGTPSWEPYRFEDIEPIAERIWKSLDGVTYVSQGSEGWPWDHLSMRRYGGTSDVRDHIYDIAKKYHEGLVAGDHFLCSKALSVLPEQAITNFYKDWTTIMHHLADNVSRSAASAVENVFDKIKTYLNISDEVLTQYIKPTVTTATLDLEDPDESAALGIIYAMAQLGGKTATLLLADAEGNNEVRIGLGDHTPVRTIYPSKQHLFAIDVRKAIYQTKIDKGRDTDGRFAFAIDVLDQLAYDLTIPEQVARDGQELGVRYIDHQIVTSPSNDPDVVYTEHDLAIQESERASCIAIMTEEANRLDAIYEDRSNPDTNRNNAWQQREALLRVQKIITDTKPVRMSMMANGHLGFGLLISAKDRRLHIEVDPNPKVLPEYKALRGFMKGIVDSWSAILTEVERKEKLDAWTPEIGQQLANEQYRKFAEQIDCEARILAKCGSQDWETMSDRGRELWRIDARAVHAESRDPDAFEKDDKIAIGYMGDAMNLQKSLEMKADGPSSSTGGGPMAAIITQYFTDKHGLKYCTEHSMGGMSLYFVPEN